MDVFTGTNWRGDTDRFARNEILTPVCTFCCGKPDKQHKYYLLCNVALQHNNVPWGGIDCSDEDGACYTM